MDKLARVEYFEIDQEPPVELCDRIKQAVNLLEDLAVDRSDHKQYAIDQAIRILLGDKFDILTVLLGR